MFDPRSRQKKLTDYRVEVDVVNRIFPSVKICDCSAFKMFRSILWRQVRKSFFMNSVFPIQQNVLDSRQQLQTSPDCLRRIAFFFSLSASCAHWIRLIDICMFY